MAIDKQKIKTLKEIARSFARQAVMAENTGYGAQGQEDALAYDKREEAIRWAIKKLEALELTEIEKEMDQEAQWMSQFN